MASIDPFDDWYSSYLDLNEGRNYRSNAWKLCTIDHDALLKAPIIAVPISEEQIGKWLDQQSSSEKTAGVHILLVRHKQLGTLDQKHRWIPLNHNAFRHVFKTLHLPMQYFHLRTTGGAQSGGIVVQTERDSKGRISRISFAIRVPHGSSAKYSSFWALAISIHIPSMHTTAFIEGLSSTSLALFTSLIQSHCLGPTSSKPRPLHPLALPEIILHMSTVHLNERIRVPAEESFYDLEGRADVSRTLRSATFKPPVSSSACPPQGATSYRTLPSIWDWKYEDFQTATRSANKCSTTLAYLKRRFRFAKHFAERLLELQLEVARCGFVDDEHVIGLLQEGEHACRERLMNRLALLEGYEHQVECVQKRVENLVTVLYTVVSQLDSRSQSRIAQINLQIARAVRSDSIPMRTIAYVTLVLLPGTFVAAIFGMNFFQFEGEKRELSVSRDFWIYWVIALPVTGGVLGAWNIWVGRETRRDIHEKGVMIMNEESEKPL